MAIDMAQFHQVFFEESFEGLDTMESGLLNMDNGVVDQEEINAIFRAAHSIKGGSGTFGFTNIAEFTHVVETMLDEMRDGRRSPTAEAVSALLGSVDVIRSMLNAARDGQAVDELLVQERQDELQEILAVPPAGTESETRVAPQQPKQPAKQPAKQQEVPAVQPKAKTTTPSSPDPVTVGWRIIFRPLPHLTRTGNDPLRIIRELAGLGELQVDADISALPEFAKLEPESCFLSWDLHLKGEVERASIDEVFDWVEDDCELIILPLLEKVQVVDVPPQPEEQAAVAPPVERRTESRRKQSRRTPLDRRGNDRRAPDAAAGSSSIRVDIEKVDSLINMVGELVITQSMLSMMGEEFTMERLGRLRDGLDQLERHTRELQESVMLIRMLPISFAFNRFPRMVHDIGAKLEKKIELQMSGENTEVDKTVIEKIGDPLVHLVRNSLDHGIELPEQRLEAGKSETGTIQLNAYHRGGNVIIEIKDDGHGLPTERIFHKAVEQGIVDEEDELSDKQIYELIFKPGFSTAAEVSDISGRGVGMDVVRRNINELGGCIEIDSVAGAGTSFTIRLPLTLAILDGQIISAGSDTYIMPLVSIIESLQVKPDMINMVAGRGETVKLRGGYIPIIRLHEIFDIKDAKATELCDGLLVVVEGEGRHCALFVDDLVGQQQVVVKSLEDNYQQVDGISGATILGDGSVSLILDVPGLFRLARGRGEDFASEELLPQSIDGEALSHG